MTPAIKLLMKEKIAFEVFEYQHDKNTKNFGKEAAQKLKLSEDVVFKTLLVVLHNKDFVVCIIGVNKKLSLKKIAKICNVKNASLANPTQAQALTGYVVGGISPIAQKKKFKTYIDIGAQKLLYMYISGGKRGLNIKINKDALVILLQAKICDIGE